LFKNYEMLSNSLKNINSLKQDNYIKKDSILNKIYNKNNYLIKIKEFDFLMKIKKFDYLFYIDLFDKKFNIKNKESKIILDKLVYLYKNYNFFAFNDIKIILFILSACGTLEEFKFFYNIFNKKKPKDEEALKKIFITSILYDNLDIFNFLISKEKKIIESINKEIKGYYSSLRKDFLLLASIYGSIKIFNDIFIKDNVNDNYDLKLSSLIHSITNNHIEIVKLIIEKTENLLTIPILDLLITAAKSVHVEIVKMIVEKGVKWEGENYKGDKLFIEASKYGRLEIIKFLIDKGAKLDEIDRNKNTALIVASENGKIEVVKFLIDKIIEGRKDILDKKELEEYNNKHLNSKNKYGYTAIISAVIKVYEDYFYNINDYLKIIELLIKSGANVDEADNLGETALMFASTRNNKKIAKILIENGADVNKKDKFGKTALMLAAQNNNDKIVELLIKNGAKVDETDNDGKTALDYAKKNEIKQLLLEAMEKQKQQEQNKS